MDQFLYIQDKREDCFSFFIEQICCFYQPSGSLFTPLLENVQVPTFLLVIEMKCLLRCQRVVGGAYQNLAAHTIDTPDAKEGTRLYVHHLVPG